MSAGESVEVTLPSNAVELNAFVVPTPPEGKTKETLDKPLQFINLKIVTHRLLNHVTSAFL